MSAEAKSPKKLTLDERLDEEVGLRSEKITEPRAVTGYTIWTVFDAEITSQLTVLDKGQLRAIGR